MSQQVFAFGSNMCSGRFRAYGVSPQGQGAPAVLRDYCLKFDKKSTSDSSGKANVAPLAGSAVWGVLYTISDVDLEKLDVGEGGYRRQKLGIYLVNEIHIDAWVYVAKKPIKDGTLRPFTWYMRFLIEGAREHALPEAYIEDLERIGAVKDPNEERDQAKRALACEAQP